MPRRGGNPRECDEAAFGRLTDDEIAARFQFEPGETDAYLHGCWVGRFGCLYTVTVFQYRPLTWRRWGYRRSRGRSRGPHARLETTLSGYFHPLSEKLYGERWAGPEAPVGPRAKLLRAALRTFSYLARAHAGALYDRAHVDGRERSTL